MSTEMTPEEFLRNVIRPLVESMLDPAMIHELSLDKRDAGFARVGTRFDEPQGWFVSVVAGRHQERGSFYLGAVQDLGHSARAVGESVGELATQLETWASQSRFGWGTEFRAVRPAGRASDVVVLDDQREPGSASDVPLSPAEFLRTVVRPMVESMLDPAMVHELSIVKHQDDVAIWPEPRPSGNYLRLHRGPLPTRKGPVRWYVYLEVGPEHERFFFSVGDVADVCDDPRMLGQGLGMFADRLEDWASESRFGWGDTIHRPVARCGAGGHSHRRPEQLRS